MSGHNDNTEPCPETEALMTRLRAAGVECELASLADVVDGDEPMFFYPADF